MLVIFHNTINEYGNTNLARMIPHVLSMHRNVFLYAIERL